MQQGKNGHLPATDDTLRPAVICLAAGPAQLPVIRKARQLGLAVVGVDRDPRAPGLALCDEAVVASTHQPEAILPALENLASRYAWLGVINRSSGPPVITAAVIGRALGLDGPHPQAARTLTDKAALMAACHQHGIAAPWCFPVRRLEDVPTGQLTFPCVVKPAMSAVGKSGVTVVPEAAGLAVAFERARQAAISDRVNLEEYLPGRDFSLTVAVIGQEAHLLLTRDELTRVRPDGSIRFDGVAVPSIFDGGPEAAAALDLARQLARAMELNRAVMNLSCRCEPGGRPRVVEVHLDLGGDLFFEKLLPACTERDLLGEMVLFLAGRGGAPAALAPLPTALVFTADGVGTAQRPVKMAQGETRGELEVKVAEALPGGQDNTGRKG